MGGDHAASARVEELDGIAGDTAIAVGHDRESNGQSTAGGGAHRQSGTHLLRGNRVEGDRLRGGRVVDDNHLPNRGSGGIAAIAGLVGDNSAVSCVEERHDAAGDAAIAVRDNAKRDRQARTRAGGYGQSGAHGLRRNGVEGDGLRLRLCGHRQRERCGLGQRSGRSRHGNGILAGNGSGLYVQNQGSDGCGTRLQEGVVDGRRESRSAKTDRARKSVLRRHSDVHRCPRTLSCGQRRHRGTQAEGGKAGHRQREGR